MRNPLAALRSKSSEEPSFEPPTVRQIPNEEWGDECYTGRTIPDEVNDEIADLEYLED